jgi:hypothetical protein
LDAIDLYQGGLPRFSDALIIRADSGVLLAPIAWPLQWLENWFTTYLRVLGLNKIVRQNKGGLLL